MAFRDFLLLTNWPFYKLGSLLITLEDCQEDFVGVVEVVVVVESLVKMYVLLILLSMLLRCCLFCWPDTKKSTFVFLFSRQQAGASFKLSMTPCVLPHNITKARSSRRCRSKKLLLINQTCDYILQSDPDGDEDLRPCDDICSINKVSLTAKTIAKTPNTFLRWYKRAFFLRQ